METDIKKTKGPDIWDRFGIFLSGLCIIHCIAVPLIIAFAPALFHRYLPEDDVTHVILLVFILGVAGFSFFPGYRTHGKKAPIFWMIPGMILVIYSTYFAHDTLGHDWESIPAIAGSLFLIKAHMVNHHCKKCDDYHHHHHHSEECEHHHHD